MILLKDSSFENMNYERNLKAMSLLRFKTYIQSYKTFWTSLVEVRVPTFHGKIWKWLDSVACPRLIIDFDGHRPRLITNFDGHCPGLIMDYDGHRLGLITDFDRHHLGLITISVLDYDGHYLGLIIDFDGHRPGLITDYDGYHPWLITEVPLLKNS